MTKNATAISSHELHAFFTLPFHILKVLVLAANTHTKSLKKKCHCFKGFFSLSTDQHEIRTKSGPRNVP